MPDTATLSMKDVRNRMRCRDALSRLQAGMEQVVGDELEIVATALEADAGALEGIIAKHPEPAPTVRHLALVRDDNQQEQPA